MKAGRTHLSRSRRDPCTLERVTGAQIFSFGGSGQDDFPGFDSRGLISYVRLGKLVLGSLFPPHQVYITDNRRSHRSNAAAHLPCVCHTPICAVLPWVVVFVGACRPYFTICLSKYHIWWYLLTYKPRLWRTRQPVPSSPLSLLLLLSLRVAVCDPTMPLLQLCSAQCAHSRSRQHAIRMHSQ